jgi:hypothetical protein
LFTFGKYNFSYTKLAMNNILKLKDLVENDGIFNGINLITNHLTKKQGEPNLILFLQETDVNNNQITINENSTFIAEKILQKFYGNKNIGIIKLKYGDIIVNESNFEFYIYQNDVEQTIIPASNFLIIRPSLGYLRSFILNDIGKAILKAELKKIYNTETNDKIELIENITIPDNLSDIENIKNEGISLDKRPIEDLELINIQQGLMTLANILTRIRYNEININTESYFQRKASLWEKDIKSRFIEALIVQQPIPAFYFDATNKDKWLIVDGLQRISAMKEYCNDEFALEDLYYLPQSFEGKKFSELPRSAQRSIEEYEVIAYRILKPTPETVKYKIFRSINTSALRLENQEIRHALNYGKATEWVKKLADLTIFKKVVPLTPKSVSRMEDRELALRYLAFRITHYEDYKPTMTEFLDNAMSSIKTVSDNQLQQYCDDFGEALFCIDRIFGEKAFKRNKFGEGTDKFTNILFEIWVYGFAILTDKQREILMKRRNIITSRVKDLLKKSNFVEAIDVEKAYNITSVKIRFKTIEQFLTEIINAK